MNAPLIITEMNKPGSIIISSSAPSLPHSPLSRPIFLSFHPCDGPAGWGRVGGRGRGEDAPLHCVAARAQEPRWGRRLYLRALLLSACAVCAAAWVCERTCTRAVGVSVLCQSRRGWQQEVWLRLCARVQVCQSFSVNVHICWSGELSRHLCPSLCVCVYT